MRVARSGAKRIVICAGRRAGKTTLAAITSVERLFEGQRILLCSASQDQADAFWAKVGTWCADAVKAKVLRKNEVRRIIERVGGAGRIKVKTASDPDALRGDAADFLVLDECALLGSDIWEAAGPLLIDSDGTAWMLSSPRPRGTFREMYAKAEQDTTGRWQAVHFTTYDNPWLPAEAISDLAGDLTDRARRQELDAEFLDSDCTVFRNYDACLKAPWQQSPQQHQGHRIVGGLDWGQLHDATALSLLCCECKVEVLLVRIVGISWQMIHQKLIKAAADWGAHILAELNAAGSPNIEALRQAGVYVNGFNTTAQSKPQLIQSLSLAFERVEVQWQSDKWARSELETFEVKIAPATGRPTYGAPHGCHDDSVIARALALRAMMQKPVRLI